MEDFFKYLLAVLLIFAGIMHFLKPKMYIGIMPKWLPAPRQLVLLSGLAEIICGGLLLIPELRTLGAWLTVLLLIAVFPANIEMSRQYYFREKKGFWLTVLRLPVQILLIWWAFQYV